jgi:AAA domain
MRNLLVHLRTLTYFGPGNEADYVLISVVRSSKPGFLNSLNRMNVMLTRCRAGLVIVTNKLFLDSETGGRHTLLGRLARHWEYYRRDQTVTSWISRRLVAEGAADLPGSLGSRRKPHAQLVPVSQNFHAYDTDVSQPLPSSTLSKPDMSGIMSQNRSASFGPGARQAVEATFANAVKFPSNLRSNDMARPCPPVSVEVYRGNVSMNHCCRAHTTMRRSQCSQVYQHLREHQNQRALLDVQLCGKQQVQVQKLQH